MKESPDKTPMIPQPNFASFDRNEESVYTKKQLVPHNKIKQAQKDAKPSRIKYALIDAT